MPKLATHLLLLIALVGAIVGVARAQSDTAAANEDQAVCRQVVERMMAAIDAGDGATIRELISVSGRSTAQQDGATAIVECIVAQRALDRAITRRWGAAPDRPAGRTSFLPADRQAVRNARVEVRTENDAYVILAPNVAPVALHRNRFDRQWRVVLRVIGELNDGEERSAEPGSQRRIGYFRAVARALTRTRDMVAANQIGSPADVGAAVLKFLSRPSQGSN